MPWDNMLCNDALSLKGVIIWLDFERCEALRLKCMHNWLSFKFLVEPDPTVAKRSRDIDTCKNFDIFTNIEKLKTGQSTQNE